MIQFYRKVRKSNINAFKKANDNISEIDLFPIVDEFNCSDNCLSVFRKDEDAPIDVIFKSLLFISMNFESSYIILDEKDFSNEGVHFPINGPCSIGYVLGEKIHCNIPDLKYKNLQTLVEIFKSKTINCIKKESGRKLFLEAYFESKTNDGIYNMDNVRYPMFLTKVYSSLNHDKTLDLAIREKELESIKESLNGICDKCLDTFIEKKRGAQ